MANKDSNLDSGSEYGDVNDVSGFIDGEDVLDGIDENAVKVFPVAFVVFNVVYWCYYMFGDDISDAFK